MGQGQPTGSFADLLRDVVTGSMDHVGKVTRCHCGKSGQISLGHCQLGRYMLAYVIEQVSLPPERIEAALRRTGTDPETVEELMGTAAQIWMEQGRTEGKAAGIVEGKAAGKVDTFLRQARLKFGELTSVHVERVRSASPEQLDAWLDALIAAEDVDAVFRERTRH